MHCATCSPYGEFCYNFYADLRSEFEWKGLQLVEKEGTLTVRSLSTDLAMKMSHSQNSFPIPKYAYTVYDTL